tara:strand:- start:533 stop:1312 length:780 start_codon:yes stop_codon:yes gene_type:complete
MTGNKEQAATTRVKRQPQNHRTVDRVTRIIEEVVHNPGMTFAELVQALEAAKSSVHGFIQGLLARGWLYEEKGRFYLGPAVYGLTLASGQIRAGFVTHADLISLHEKTGMAVFLGVQAGDHLIYVAEAGTGPVEDFAARSNIRRKLLITAAGKALLAEKPDSGLATYLRNRSPEEIDSVNNFLDEIDEIKRTRIATNRRGERRFAIATVVRSLSGEAVAAVTLVGPTQEMEPRADELGKLLIRQVDSWASRSISPREAI